MISERAKQLIEALHEPFSNEERWEIAQRFLDEERADFAAYVMGTVGTPGSGSLPGSDRNADGLTFSEWCGGYSINHWTDDATGER